MPAKTDLEDILENLLPSLIDESYVFITSKEPINVLVNSLNPVATFTEDEGSTLVITKAIADKNFIQYETVFNCISLGCLLYTSPSPRDRQKSRMPSSA